MFVYTNVKICVCIHEISFHVNGIGQALHPFCYQVNIYEECIKMCIGSV